jgi:di/tricarboxylate transporter
MLAILGILGISIGLFKLVLYFRGTNSGYDVVSANVLFLVLGLLLIVSAYSNARSSKGLVQGRSTRLTLLGGLVIVMISVLLILLPVLFPRR